MINFKFKILIGTCYGTAEGTCQGHVEDINNNDNNIYLFLFNKYKKQISFKQNFKEKQTVFELCMNDEKYKELSEEEKTKLYTSLISVI